MKLKTICYGMLFIFMLIVTAMSASARADWLTDKNDVWYQHGGGPGSACYFDSGKWWICEHNMTKNSNDFGPKFFNWYNGDYRDISMYDEVTLKWEFLSDPADVHACSWPWFNVRGGRSVPCGICVLNLNEVSEVTFSLRDDCGLTDEELTHINFFRSNFANNRDRFTIAKYRYSVRLK